MVKTTTVEPHSFGPIQMFSLAFGVAVGVGWIVVVGQWVDSAGPLGAALAFAIGALALLPIALSYAAVAVRLRGLGGEYFYVSQAFGARAGFWVGWALLLAYIVVLAFEIVSIAWLTRETFGLAPSKALIDLNGTAMGCAILAVVFAANLLGAAAAARLQVGLVALKVGASLALIAAGLALGSRLNFVPHWGRDTSLTDAAGFLGVLAVAPYFFAGFGVVAQAVAAGPITSSTRKLPGVMVLVLLVTLLFYAGVIFAVAGAAPRQVLATATLPAATAFTRAFASPLGGQAVLIIGYIGLLTVANGVFFAAIRIVQALAADGLLPSVFVPDARARRATVYAAFLVAGVAVAISLLGRAAIGSVLAAASAALCFVMASVPAALLRVAKGQHRVMGWAGVVLGAALTLFALTDVARSVGPPLLLLPIWLVAGASMRRRPSIRKSDAMPMSKPLNAEPSP